MTTDKSRADALTEHLYILSVNEEAMEEAIERFDGSSTGEALTCVLHAQKQLRALLVTPVEQRKAAPAEDHECVYENGDGICRACAELAKRAKHETAPADAATANDRELLIAMIDAAMEEMKNIDPPLSRPDCKRLIYAAVLACNHAVLSGQPTPSAPLEGTGNGADEQFERFVPLHELSADAAALCHRVQQGSLSPDDLAAHIRTKIDAGLANARAPRTDVAGAVSTHDAKGLEIVAGWLDRDGLIEPAAMLRRIASTARPPSVDAAAAPADERAAFERHQGYPRPDYDGVAQEAWDFHRETWYAALAYARAAASQPAAAAGQEAVAWVRKHPDTGKLSGDWLWNDVIEQCRKESGVWFPLGYLTAPPAQVATAPHDGNHVENHCPECGQYESECECAQIASRQGLTDAARDVHAERRGKRR